MVLSGFLWVAGAVVLVALVLGAVAIIGGWRSGVPGAASLAPDPWVHDERTRLLAATLLGAIAAAASAISGVRFGTWGGLFVAGSVGAFVTLLGALLMPAPQPPGPVGAAPGRRGPRLLRPAVAGMAAVALVGVAAGFAEVSPEGGWGLPHRFVSTIHHARDGQITVEYGSGYLTPWVGWPDAVAALLLVVGVLLLWVLVQRRLQRDATAAGGSAAEELRRQRVQVLEGVCTGGLLAQVGLAGFILGSPLAMLTDVDSVPTSQGALPQVAVQPQATIGVLLAIVGVVALVLAIAQLVLAMLALTRLGVSGRLVNSA